MRKLLRAGCLFALTTLMGCTGDAAEPKTSSKEAAAAPAAQQLNLTTSSAGLVEQQTANGVMVQLDGHFESAVMARRNADGTLSVECHDEQHQAEAFVQGAGAGAKGGVK